MSNGNLIGTRAGIFISNFVSWKLRYIRQRRELMKKTVPYEYPTWSEGLQEATKDHRDRYIQSPDCRNCKGKCLHKDVGGMEICTRVRINRDNQAYIGKFIDEC